MNNPHVTTRFEPQPLDPESTCFVALYRGDKASGSSTIIGVSSDPGLVQVAARTMLRNPRLNELLEDLDPIVREINEGYRRALRRLASLKGPSQ